MALKSVIRELAFKAMHRAVCALSVQAFLRGRGGRCVLQRADLCRQADGGGSRTLREGAVYIRPAGTPRTEEIHTHRDMRDIIE